MSNRSVGNAFEREFAQTLAHYGFWVHLMAQTASGQPADVIAVRNGKPYLIDCKVCEQDWFRFDRIEDNQFCAMQRWFETGNPHGWFALKLSNGEVYMVNNRTIRDLYSEGFCSMTLRSIENYGFTLEEWVSIY